MFSQLKHEDRLFLKDLGELIILLAQTGKTEAVDLAEKLGDHYTSLEEKISIHDYTKDELL